MVSEEVIQAASAELNSDPNKSLRAVAKDFNVPRSTLQSRIKNGHQPHSMAHQNAQRLFPEQEHWIARWIIEEDRKGDAPSYAKVMHMAALICAASGDTDYIGHNWIYNFAQRNPTVKPLIGRKIDIARVRCGGSGEISAYFTLLKDVIAKYKIKTCNIYNMDEHGTNLGASQHTKVMGEAEKAVRGVTHKKTPENREWVSMIETISYSGRPVPPVVIFKGATPQTTWFPLHIAMIDLTGWKFACSQNGWTSNDIGLEWFTKVFIPATSPPTPTEWRLLIVDGHGSHVTNEFMMESWNNKTYVIYLPAHTSHLTQPLDLCVFGPLKVKYHQEVEKLASLDDESVVKKRNFVEIYAKARQLAITGRNQQSGFKTAGIIPYNPAKVLELPQIKEMDKSSPQEASKTLETSSNSKRKASELVGLSDRAARGVVRDIKDEMAAKALKIAELQQKLELYKQTVGDLEKRKRKRIKPQPNSRFIDKDQIEKSMADSQAEMAAEQAKKMPNEIGLKLKFGLKNQENISPE